MLKQEQVETPELKKMQAVSNRSQIIGEFLEWLVGEEISLVCWENKGCKFCFEAGYVFLDKTTQQLLAEYFDIDLNKCEQERRALLDVVRKDNKNN